MYTAILVLINSFGGLLGISEVQASTITPTNIVSLTNKERVKYGLGTLKNNSKLSSAALAKANNMFKEQYWNHFGPNGETPWQFIKAAGYTYVYAGENLAKGFKSAEGVVDAWMASPTHKENIVSGNYVDIGVAVVDGKLLGEQVTLVVQMFGNPTNVVTPTPQTNTKPKPTNNENGQTLSISITSPKDNQILNDAGVDIKGKVDGNSNSEKYTVEISDKNGLLGGFESNGSTWEWDKKSDWSEGDHKVTVKIKDTKGSSDTVNFSIDTQAPALRDFNVKITADGWEFDGEVDDKDGTYTLVSGDYTKALIINNDGKFNDILLSGNRNEKVVIIATDNLGNADELDVSSYFLQEENSILGVFQSFMNNLGRQDTLNAIFLAFIFMLLLIEVITYARKKLLLKHSGNLFTLGFWWLIVFIGVINGFGGSLI